MLFCTISRAPLTCYQMMRRLIARDGEGFLVVYSIANRSTFERVDRIIDRVVRIKSDAASSPYSPTTPTHQGAGSRRPPIVIVGNKKDLFATREVSTDEGRALAQRTGCEFFEASAKQNTNVEAAFKAVVRGIKAARGGTNGYTGAPGSGAGSAPRRRRNKACVIL